MRTNKPHIHSSSVTAAGLPLEGDAISRPRPRIAGLFAILSVLLVLFSRVLIPTPTLDWLNLLPAAAALYLAACLIAPRKVLGNIGFVVRSLPSAPLGEKPEGKFLLPAWMRSSLLLPVAFLIFEFLFRCGSYHRTVYYERQGDLLFTPAPNQEAIEKISLTPSRINNYGLRGPDLADGDLRKHVVLCLGDSITYGYGVDDAHAYPAQLQAALDRTHPGQFTVLNGGANAYPVTFMHQKFLYLWTRGIHPEIVVVGYSMNEGWLGHLVDSDAATKNQFARRVRLKNFLRSFALYNLVVENWGIEYYERFKDKMLPGTHSVDWSEKSYDERYERALERLVADLRGRNVTPVFLDLSAFNGQTGKYDSEGFLQREFAAFAARHSIPFLRTDEVFHAAANGGDIASYFRDRCHMNERGNAALAARLASLLTASSNPLPRVTTSNQ